MAGALAGAGPLLMRAIGLGGLWRKAVWRFMPNTEEHWGGGQPQEAGSEVCWDFLSSALTLFSVSCGIS